MNRRIIRIRHVWCHLAPIALTFPDKFPVHGVESGVDPLDHSVSTWYSTWDRTDIGTIKMDKGSLYFSDSLMPIGKENA